MGFEYPFPLAAWGEDSSPVPEESPTPLKASSGFSGRKPLSCFPLLRLRFLARFPAVPSLWRAPAPPLRPYPGLVPPQSSPVTLRSTQRILVSVTWSPSVALSQQRRAPAPCLLQTCTEQTKIGFGVRQSSIRTWLCGVRARGAGRANLLVPRFPPVSHTHSPRALFPEALELLALTTGEALSHSLLPVLCWTWTLGSSVETWPAGSPRLLPGSEGSPARAGAWGARRGRALGAL